MNTITKSASTNIIVAIDLGKYKSVGSVCDQATGEFHFTTFEKRADVDINDTLLIQKNKSCERNFDGEVMKGKWVRNKNGTITIGFPNPAKDKNRLTVQSCKDGKMETVSKSGLLEKWTKK
jgi:hypothetical protein